MALPSYLTRSPPSFYYLFGEEIVTRGLTTGDGSYYTKYYSIFPLPVTLPVFMLEG